MTRRPRPDEINVGDLVKLSANSVTYRVIEKEDRKRQAYWGYWFSNIKLQAITSGRKRSAYTSDVILLDESTPGEHE